MDDFEGRYTVKSACGLVEKEDLWGGDELTGYRDSSLLTTRQALLNRCSDDHIGLVE